MKRINPEVKTATWQRSSTDYNTTTEHELFGVTADISDYLSKSGHLIYADLDVSEASIRKRKNLRGFFGECELIDSMGFFYHVGNCSVLLRYIDAEGPGEWAGDKPRVRLTVTGSANSRPERLLEEILKSAKENGKFRRKNSIDDSNSV